MTPPPATPVIAWPAPAAIAYGTALSATQLNATANVAGTFTYSPASGTVLGAGTHTLSASFTPSDPTKATTVTASNSIVVNKAIPQVTWAQPSAVAAGATLGDIQLNAVASIPGTFTYTPPAGTVVTVAGVTTLTAVFTPTDNQDYSAVTSKVSLTVTGPGPTYSFTNVKVVGGGYITGVYFHPAQQNLMYARTDVGGAYRWSPTDTQWVPLLDFTSRANWWQMGVEAIGLDPTDPNKLYIAVGEYANENWDGNGAMLVSNDQGNTFTTVPLAFKNGSNDAGRNTGDRIAVDPNLPSTVYFGTRVAGLQLSTDSGAHWAQTTGLPVTKTANGNGVISVLPIRTSGSTGSATPVVYAAVAGTGVTQNAVTDPVGLYVTTNAGSPTTTWAPVAGQPNFAAAATPLAPLQAKLGPNGALYILYGDQTGPDTMAHNELWKFVPSAGWTTGTWTQISLPNNEFSINITNGYGGIALDPAHPGVLLLGSLDQYYPTGDVIYRSNDDGATWRDVSSVKAPDAPLSVSPGLATHDASLSPWLAFGGANTSISTGNWATAIAIDPFNPDHAIYGTGQTLWKTSNLTTADPSASSNGVINWTVGANGIEETVVEGLWAPPSGYTVLLSSLDDVAGFAHHDLTISPPQQMYASPRATPSSMDFEQSTPTTVVRVNAIATPYGSISTDGGMNWTPFATTPPGLSTPQANQQAGGGTIAIAPDGSSMVWAPADTSSVWYSKDGGATWTASTGVAAQAQVVSDRVAPGVFYGFAGTTLTMSTDGGATFATLQTGLPGGSILTVLPDAQGDLWLSGQAAGLFSNTGMATAPRLTTLSGVTDAWHLGFGAPANGSAVPTLYLDGQVGTTPGIYRSIDAGNTWLLINDTAHQYGALNGLCGDMRTFGTVYLATGGRGIIWATSSN
ncbi:carbohydrate-binding protein [Acidobacteria bacterium AB60]|nr:carbohydrate-binding protein [Acidobacteria bacterium AB60]